MHIWRSLSCAGATMATALSFRIDVGASTVRGAESLKLSAQRNETGTRLFQHSFGTVLKSFVCLL